MQKESDIQNIEDLPALKLFEMAEEKNEEMNNQEAEYFYSKAYEKSPENDIIVLCYAEFLKSNNSVELSKQILIKSLKQRPKGSYKRYFQLAQLYQGEESIKIFQQGIKKALESNPVSLSLFSNDKTSQKQISRDVANAYAAIAEVCMTDLIDYPQAQGKCIQSLQLGQKYDPYCLDVILQQGNYLLFKDKQEQAKNKFIYIYQQIIEKPDDHSDQLKQQTAKLLIEVQSWNEAIEILDNLNQNTGKDLEIVYLLAFSYYQSKKYDRCVQHLEECQQLMKESMDDEIVDAVKQLRIEINKLDPKLLEEPEPADTVQEDEDWMDVEEDGQ